MSYHPSTPLGMTVMALFVQTLYKLGFFHPREKIFGNSSLPLNESPLLTCAWRFRYLPKGGRTGMTGELLKLNMLFSFSPPYFFLCLISTESNLGILNLLLSLPNCSGSIFPTIFINTASSSESSIAKTTKPDNS